LEIGHGPDPGDLAIGHHDGGIRLGGGPGAVDHRDIRQHGGRAQSRRGKARRQQRRSAQFQNLHSPTPDNLPVPRALAFYGRGARKKTPKSYAALRHKPPRRAKKNAALRLEGGT